MVCVRGPLIQEGTHLFVLLSSVVPLHSSHLTLTLPIASHSISQSTVDAETSFPARDRDGDL